MQTYTNDILEPRVLCLGTTYQNAENDYRSASTEAENLYISTVLVGWNTYNNKVDELDLLFESAVASRRFQF
jgi:hypothetical protein